MKRHQLKHTRSPIGYFHEGTRALEASYFKAHLNTDQREHIQILKACDPFNLILKSLFITQKTHKIG